MEYLTSAFMQTLLFDLNHLIDTGKYDEITIAEVNKHCDAGDVINWLESRVGNDIDLSLWDENRRRELNIGLQDVFAGYGGSERRKFGVENKGLCVLVAWVLSLIQRGDAAPPP